MSYKVFINAGHGGSDPGAVGYVVEKDVNLKVAKACRDYLVARDVEVMMTEEDLNDEDLSSASIIKVCNRYKPDIAADLHMNSDKSGKAKGFEIYHSIVGGKGANLAKCIEDSVKAMGQESRGVKTRKNSAGSDYYYFIRETDCPAVIVEGAFVNNPEDAAKIDSDADCKAFGEAYARGIIAYFGIKSATENSVITDVSKDNKVTEQVSEATKQVHESAEQAAGYLVEITASALNIRDGAGTGYKVNGVITDNKALVKSNPKYYHPKTIYTIVETKGNWGRLKSGAGWISLSYTRRV